MSEGLSYAIIGSGAVGIYHGGLLARAGRTVHFLMRSDAHHVREHGLKVESKDGDYHLHDVNVWQDPAAIPPVDVTVVAVKTTANDQLRQLLCGATRDGGVVLMAQNGLDPEAAAAAVVGPERVYGGGYFLCSNKVGPGHIAHLDYGTLAFGKYRPPGAPEQGITEMVQRLEDDMRAAKIDARAVENLPAARWKKLVWNIPFNGLSVVLDAATDELLERAEPLVRSLMRETVAAARACGTELGDEAIEGMIAHTRKMTPYDSSMRLDWKAGRPMEVEAIFGQPVRAAAAAGADVPRIEMLYRQLTYLNR